MLSQEWKNAFEVLRKIAMEKTTAFLCSERFPFRCHRRYIARKLFGEGWRVIHILNDNVWEEK